MELERFWGIAENGESIEVAVMASLVDELDRRWPPLGLVRSREPDGTVSGRVGLSNEWIIVPDTVESGDRPPPVAWDLLESTLTLFAVSRLTRLVAVHSAAIAHNGRVLVVPAVSEGGKSTLSIAAVAAGALLLSDEYTLIDPGTGLVTGWRRPVRRRCGDGTTERLDLVVPSQPMVVGLIAAVTYDPSGQGTWSPVSPAEATTTLLAHTVCARSRPDDALDAVLAITRTTPAVAGHRPDASTAIEALLDLMDQSQS
ncbi:MAG: hypothetical protein KDB09_13195 [Acidimicrobiales bacterium]|nr:hypothetical protein [Acidimicrobiales bacterium]